MTQPRKHFTCFPHWLMRCGDLFNNGEFRVICALSSHVYIRSDGQRDKEWWYVPLKRLAEETNMTVPYVSTCISKFEALKLIATKKVGNQNYYQILWRDGIPDEVRDQLPACATDHDQNAVAAVIEDEPAENEVLSSETTDTEVLYSESEVLSSESTTSVQLNNYLSPVKTVEATIKKEKEITKESKENRRRLAPEEEKQEVIPKPEPQPHNQNPTHTEHPAPSKRDSFIDTLHNEYHIDWNMAGKVVDNYQDYVEIVLDEAPVCDDPPSYVKKMVRQAYLDRPNKFVLDKVRKKQNQQKERPNYERPERTRYAPASGRTAAANGNGWRSADDLNAEHAARLAARKAAGKSETAEPPGGLQRTRLAS